MNHFRRFLVSAIFSLSVSPALRFQRRQPTPSLRYATQFTHLLSVDSKLLYLLGFPLRPLPPQPSTPKESGIAIAY